MNSLTPQRFVFSTIVSVFRNVVKQGLSCLTYYVVKHNISCLIFHDLLRRLFEESMVSLLDFPELSELASFLRWIQNYFDLFTELPAAERFTRTLKLTSIPSHFFHHVALIAFLLSFLEGAVVTITNNKTDFLLSTSCKSLS